MSLRRWALLQLIKSDMDVLEPFVRFLNKEINQLFLKIVWNVGSHDISPSRQ
jgi:hypothetical protein